MTEVAKTDPHKIIITLTEAAGKHIAYLASQEDQPNAALRIVVKGGGCSGLKYEYVFPAYDLDSTKDTIIKNNGGTLAINFKSLEYMKDSIVDYEDTVAHSGFNIKNPQATANCGCGNSFDV